MALVIEAGSGANPAANSYITVQELRDYASARGTDLSSSTDAALEAIIIKAMDYLERLRARYIGKKRSATQPLQWPRISVRIDGYDVASDVIPGALKNALAQLVTDAVADATSNPDPSTEDRRAVQAETVGPLSKSYFEGRGPSKPSRQVKAVEMLAPLLMDANRVVRA